MQDLSARALDRFRRPIDVTSIGEPKTEVFDAARSTDVFCSFLQHKDVTRSGSLSLKKIHFPIKGDHPEHIVIELERSVEIADG